MLQAFNTRVRDIIRRLIKGESVTIAGDAYGPLKPDALLALRLIASDLASLQTKKGADLAQAVSAGIEKLGGVAIEADDEAAAKSPPILPWRLHATRACSFRGLAPAGQVWRYDFEGLGHLLYGPNGCGKSSLLGAIAWCLTGRVFRDDRPSAPPEAVDVYSAEKRAKKVASHPDALTLTNGTGDNVPADSEYWVECQFRCMDNGKHHECWIRRHAKTGLAISLDGTSWSKASSIHATGIDELDAELQIVMPARLPHLYFGPNPDIIRLFSQMIGLDELEAVASVAADTGSALRRIATTTDNNEIKQEQQKIAAEIAAITETATTEVKQLAHFSPATQETGRTSQAVEDFGKSLAAKLEDWKGQLANDLGIEVPAKDAPEYAQFEKKLADLSGRVLAAISQLERPVTELFSRTFSAGLLSGENLVRIEQLLQDFETSVRTAADERLKWAMEERNNPKAGLLLHAASHFSADGTACPVCGQDLDGAPEVAAQLAALRQLAARDYLRQKLDDFQRSMVSRLSQIVNFQQRQMGDSQLPARVAEDWADFKAKHAGGLLADIANRFDAQVAQAIGHLRPSQIQAPNSFEGEYAQDFPGQFDELTQAVLKARAFIALCHSIEENATSLSAQLVEALSGTTPAADSLLLVLRRGSTASGEMKALEGIIGHVRTLWKAQKQIEELRDRVSRYRSVAAALDAISGLQDAVRAETAGVISQVQPKMKDYYSALYKGETLELDMLTPGHPANPDVKNQLNAYFRAGKVRVPIAPFSNAGRLRALMLSFVFALLQRRTGTLALLVLDDPAMSLDDQHKARFLDELVAPHLSSLQVIMATHYETFFKHAEPVFRGSQKLQMPPRRTCLDAVEFEPADLLERVKVAATRSDCSWREAGVNLRRWAERTLATISGYCPKSFVRFNDLPGSIDAYAKITDPGIASPERDKIVAHLKDARFQRVMHRCAHDEDPKDTEVTDGLTVLLECSKTAGAEIDRLKGLYRHELLGRGMSPRPTIETLILPETIPSVRLKISGRAAASKDGTGVTWAEDAAAIIDGYQAALIRASVLEPVALAGQVVLLAPEGGVPSSGDLVTASSGKKHYARRLWIRDGIITLEGVNRLSPYEPVIVSSGQCFMRRIAGVLFRMVTRSISGGLADEWCPTSLGGIDDLGRLMGVRVDGRSLEPIARNGQLLLAYVEDAVGNLRSGDLACVDCHDRGTFVKRCYPGDPAWILCPVNPGDSGDPIVVSRAEIAHVYPLAGVLFETSGESA